MTIMNNTDTLMGYILKWEREDDNVCYLSRNNHTVAEIIHWMFLLCTKWNRVPTVLSFHNSISKPKTSERRKFVSFDCILSSAANPVIFISFHLFIIIIKLLRYNPCNAVNEPSLLPIAIAPLSPILFPSFHFIRLKSVIP